MNEIIFYKIAIGIVGILTFLCLVWHTRREKHNHIENVDVSNVTIIITHCLGIIALSVIFEIWTKWWMCFLATFIMVLFEVTFKNYRRELRNRGLINRDHKTRKRSGLEWFILVIAFIIGVGLIYLQDVDSKAEYVWIARPLGILTIIVSALLMDKKDD